MGRDETADETTGTVLLALSANVGVAIAKIAGGIVSGSAALLSEGAHSVTDVLNEVFLWLSLHRAARPADRTHPFGYGMERFFWSLLAAGGILVAGAGFAVYEGTRAVVGPDEHTSTTKFVIVYVVLALSLVFESVSLTRAVRQVRREAVQAGRRFLVYVLRSPDPTVKTVASEDTAAVIGIVIAAAGTALHQATGSDMWEGIASFLIAGLLAYVALALGRDTKELLIGEAADPAVRIVALDVIADHKEVERVAEILTMQLGPRSVLVAARLQFVPELRAREIERLCTDIETEMHRRVPALEQVFLDPSTVTDEQLAAGRQRLDQSVEEVRRLDGADAAVLQALEAGRSARTRAARRITTP